MRAMSVTATASQSEPAATALEQIEHPGIVYVQASGTGAGTWAGTLNIRAISAATMEKGSVRQYSISNTTPMVDADLQTGCMEFIMWWSAVSGTCNLKGSLGI